MTNSTITFAQLGLSEPLLRALSDKKYTQPSPIQAEAIPHLLAGRDILGSAQTGTGKTAAFALPILQRLSGNNVPRQPRCPRALILTPTRELAVQIGASFAAYGKHLPLRHVIIYGGVGQHPQVRAVANGAEIVIATPGRLLDLANQGHLRFDCVEVFVLDEADRMLDMGFAPDLKRIVSKLKPERQSLLFSATLPGSILELASRVVRDPVRVQIKSETTTAEGIDQRVCFVSGGDKYPLLRHLLEENKEGLVLAFTRTKHGAKKLAKHLNQDGIRADDIHGNKSQSARERSLANFRAGKLRVLVATDVAARGIDVKGISLVVNYDVPHEPEAYVHRIGRTARAGALGMAIAFCSPEERSNLRGIQRLLRTTIPVHSDHPFAMAAEQSHAPRPSHHQRPAHHARPAHHTAYSARPVHSNRGPSDYRADSQHQPELARSRPVSMNEEYGQRPAQSSYGHQRPAFAGGHRPGAGYRHSAARQQRGGVRSHWGR